MSKRTVPTEKELQDQLKKMSYYNAAEGDWSKEAGNRQACRKELKRMVAELMSVGITIDDIRKRVKEGGHLITDGDIFVKTNK